ncbi:MAG: hypothetical protein ACRDNP_10210 [Gaiellaceae bacterium]
MLAVIGRDWLKQVNDPTDFVRLELASALESGRRVLPVLVGGAYLPAAEELPPDLEGLARRNAIELTDARWAYDVTRLIAVLERVLDGVR